MAAGTGVLSFWRDADPTARRALVAASLGWMLDAFDVMLYALVLSAVRTDLSLTREVAGGLQSLTLLASAAGGLLFGVLADRWGRTRALMLSVLIYSVFTAACGLAQSALQLAVFRIFLGIGMGGEWASGAALVSETWKAKDRGKALGLMQSSWAIGYGLAAARELSGAGRVRPAAGAASSLPASCPPCSRCGCGATSPSLRCGGRRKRARARAFRCSTR